MTPNEIKAVNIARGFACGNCDHDEALEQNCEDGCIQLRDEILAALDAKDRKHREGANAKPANPEKYPSHSPAASEMLTALIANNSNFRELERRYREEGDDKMADLIRVNCEANERTISRATGQSHPTES